MQAQSLARSAADVTAVKRDYLLLLGFTLSGFTALGLELVWIKVLGLAFGAERFAVLAVLSGFFAGMSAGAAWVQRSIATLRRPALTYIGCELVIGVYALTSANVMLDFTRWLPTVMVPIVGDNQSTLALLTNTLISMLILLPATMAMGATTALLVEAWRRRLRPDTRHLSVGRLYAANTIGAVAGIGAVTYVLIPVLGLKLAAWVCLGASAAAMVLVLVWSSATPTTRQITSDFAPGARTHANSKGLWLLAATGFLAIALEFLAVQVLAQVLEDTVYTFANLLLVYLIGTSLGAWLYTTSFVQRRIGAIDLTRRLLVLLGLSLVLSGFVLANSGALVSWLVPLGSSFERYLLADLVIAVCVFSVPTVLMGMLFSHLVGEFTERGIGYAYAINTLGGTLGPIVVSVALLPLFGPTFTLFLLITGYLALYLWAANGTQAAWFAAVGITLVAIMAVGQLVLVRLPPGFSSVAQKVGLYGVITVGERSAGSTTDVRLLQVNQNFLMGGALGFIERRMGHLPLLIAPDRARVLYLGVGTGITAGAATAYDDVDSVTAVELVPDIIEFLPLFAQNNARLYENPKVELLAFDARRFVTATQATYDVIVADLFHPSRDGAGSLYTVEHFGAIADRLAGNGVFVQWLPIYQMQVADTQLTVRSFLSVFERADAVLSNFNGQAALGLVGWRGPRHAPPPGRLAMDFQRANAFAGPADLAASYLTNRTGLAAFAGSGYLNTDANQRMIHSAARAIATDDPFFPYRTLSALLPYAVRPDATWIVHDPGAGADREAMAAATMAFIKGDIELHRSAEPAVSQVAMDHLSESLRRGYRPALALLVNAARLHPDQAETISERLLDALPGNPEVREFANLVHTAPDRGQLVQRLTDLAVRL